MPTVAVPRMDAMEALRQSPHPQIRSLQVTETSLEIVIHGTLPSYYLKQLAQETLRPVLCGRKLVNRVHVVDDKPPPK